MSSGPGWLSLNRSRGLGLISVFVVMLSLLGFGWLSKPYVVGFLAEYRLSEATKQLVKISPENKAQQFEALTRDSEDLWTLLSREDKGLVKRPVNAVGEHKVDMDQPSSATLATHFMYVAGDGSGGYELHPVLGSVSYRHGSGHIGVISMTASGRIFEMCTPKDDGSYHSHPSLSHGSPIGASATLDTSANSQVDSLQGYIASPKVLEVD